MISLFKKWRSKKRFSYLAAWIVFTIYAVPVVHAAPYHLGQGYPLPFYGLGAGGYLSVQGSAQHGEGDTLSVQDISLFLHKDITPDWHFFTEIELGTPIQFVDGSHSTRKSDLDVERFYVDHNLSARTTLRLGKFLTPVGRWNQIHADPLVWTVSRPLTTSTAFAKNASGAEIYGTWPFAESSIDYQLYLDDSEHLDPSEGHELVYTNPQLLPNPPNAFDQGIGGRLLYRTFNDDLQIGLSIGHYAMKDQPGYKNLVGTDVFYTYKRMELQGEAVYRQDAGDARRKEWGGYLQMVVPIVGDFYGVVSHERYKAEIFNRPVNSDVLDITYRPIPPFSIKIEHRHSSGEVLLAPSGWFVSMALLF